MSKIGILRIRDGEDATKLGTVDEKGNQYVFIDITEMSTFLSEMSAELRMIRQLMQEIVDENPTDTREGI